MFSGARFDRACAASGLTNGQIARAIGHDESFVRRIRLGEKRLPDDCYEILPESVRAHLFGPLVPASKREAEIEKALLGVLRLVRGE